MLIFDQLNKADRHLRVLSWVVAIGVLMLLAGVWWVQVVRSRAYVEDQRNQSYRTVRVPAPRGKILDRNGVVLAENRPTYNVNLYLEDHAWRENVRAYYKRIKEAASQATLTTRQPRGWEKFLSWFGYKASLEQYRKLSRKQTENLEREARYRVTSNIVAELGAIIKQPLILDEEKFHQHYKQSLALPLPVLSDLNAEQVARLQERGLNLPGVDMESVPTRVYPLGTTAAHVLGYLTRTKDSVEDELAYYNYPLPYYRGLSGIEATLDDELRGKAGAKSVLVNNLGYRQNETILSPIEAGKDVTLSIDAEIQRVAEKALASAPGAHPPVRGAAVVMDVRTGEVIALASAPVFNPNDWIPFLKQETWNTYTNEEVAPLQNRSVYGNFAPGSTFKIIVALAGLEAGTLDTNEVVKVEPNPQDPYHGIFYVSRQHSIKDLARPGNYDFRLAFVKSSNSYFVRQGLRVGPERIVSMAQRFHFGEPTGIPLQESRGLLPTPEWIRVNRGAWSPAATGNLSIGQGDLDLTPLQLTVAMAAIANGGKVLAPQLVLQVHGENELIDPRQQLKANPVVRGELNLSRHALEVVRSAMLSDVEANDGTGSLARVDGYRICAKTGTAQVQRNGKLHHHTVWFSSYAPFENPRYAVVVMVDYGTSGGTTCAPVAGRIYQALKYRDQRTAGREAVARN